MVAPRAGAWIETTSMRKNSQAVKTANAYEYRRVTWDDDVERTNPQKLHNGTEGRNRTGTPRGNQILSLARLPVPPPRQVQ